MRLAITQEDIYRACRAGSRGPMLPSDPYIVAAFKTGMVMCPVECALERETGYQWEVNLTSAYCESLRKTIRLPKQVTALIARWDRGEPVEPLEFETVEP